MLKTVKSRLWLLVGLLLLVLLINISLGSVNIPFKTILKSFTGSVNDTSSVYILYYFRFPKAITAILVGSGLGVSGLLMQTLFRNPLAGPFVLGINSGASLGVALIIMSAGMFSTALAPILTSEWSLVIAASLGSFLVLSAVTIMAYRIRDTMAILIIGLMFGSLTSALVSVLAYFSSAQQLQQYIFWGFGSLGHLSWTAVCIFSTLVVLGFIISLGSIKFLNSLLLGEVYTRSMGINIKKHRLLIIITTSLLAGTITAFAGPIAFIGLAIPHLTRLIFNSSNHKILLPAVMLFGAIIMLICDIIAQLPTSSYTLPINAITSLIGAPVIIWLLLKKRRLLF